MLLFKIHCLAMVQFSDYTNQYRNRRVDVNRRLLKFIHPVLPAGVSRDDEIDGQLRAGSLWKVYCGIFSTCLSQHRSRFSLGASRSPALCPHVLQPCPLTSSCLVPSRPPALSPHFLLPCALTSSCLVPSLLPALCPYFILPCAPRRPALCPRVLLRFALMYSCLVPSLPAVVCVVG